MALKVALFGGVLLLGGLNHFFVRRRLARELGGSDTGGARSLFRRTIAGELVIALLLMAVTGLLAGLSRTRQETPEASSRRVSEMPWQMGSSAEPTHR